MADTKISQLPGSTTPLAGTEVLPIVQSGTTKQVSVANLTAGRNVACADLTTTGNVILGDASTDTVQVNGYMGVGVAPSSAQGIKIGSTGLTSAFQYGLFSNVSGNSSATTFIAGVATSPTTEASVFTATDVAGFRASTPAKGAGSTITNLHGVYVADQTQGTNNYGITSLVSSGANKWNIYASGTANNYFAGSVGVGTTSPLGKLHVETQPSGGGITPSINGDELVLENNSNCGLTIGTENLASIFFGKAADSDIGGIGYAMTENSMRFTTNAAERMRIDSAGNVGIGTSAPSANLEVAGAVGNFKTTGHQIFLTRNGNNEIYTVGASSILALGTNSAEKMRIDSAGNTFIGTTTNTNSSKLVVNGTISETVSSTQYLVASQADIGTAPNEIPLNGYLGSLAYQDTAPVAAPASATAAGSPGQIAYDSSYFYVCTAVNTWKRVAIATW